MDATRERDGAGAVPFLFSADARAGQGRGLRREAAKQPARAAMARRAVAEGPRRGKRIGAVRTNPTLAQASRRHASAKKAAPRARPSRARSDCEIAARAATRARGASRRKAPVARFARGAGVSGACGRRGHEAPADAKGSESEGGTPERACAPRSAHAGIPRARCPRDAPRRHGR
jgi:hypothetical protein